MENKSASETSVNPLTGEAIITLKDGVARKVLFDMSALIMAEQQMGVSLINGFGVSAITSVRGIQVLTWACLYHDATERREHWTLDKVASLIEPTQLASLNRVLGVAMRAALFGPKALREDDAAGGATATGPQPPKPKGGAGRKR